MQAAAVQPVSRAPQTRHRALEIYLEQIRQCCAAGGDSAPLSIGTEAGPVDVDAWTAARLRRLPGVSSGSGFDPELISHVVALTMKSRVDCAHVERLGDRRDATLFTVQAELMLDVAIGLALLRETHQAVQDVVRQGDMETARTLSRIHHDLRHLVGEVKERVADSEHDRADALADSLTDRPRSTSREEQTPRPNVYLHSELSRRDSWRKILSRRSLDRAVPVWFPSSTELLVTALFAALFIWGAMNFNPGQRNQPIPRLSSEDLPSVAMAVQVLARPPSLFLRAATEDWEALGTIEQQRWLNAVGTRVMGDGYTGVLIQGGDGRPLAQWFETGGTRLIEAVEGPSPDPASGSGR